LKVLCMHSYWMYNLWHAFLLLIQYIGETPSNPKMAKMCMNSSSYLYAHIYVEFVLYITVSLTTSNPMSLGTILYLHFVFGTWIYVGSCINNKDEVVTMII
jgi:hypothetical protein